MASEGLYRLYLRDLPEGVFEVSYLLDDEFIARGKAFELYGGEVEVVLNGTRAGEVFHVSFSLKGEVDTPCTRCEEPLRYPLSESFQMVIKLGEVYADDGDQELIVPRTSPTLELDDLLYNFLVLSLPLRRVHPDGECTAEVENYLAERKPQEIEENPFAKLLKENFPHTVQE